MTNDDGSPLSAAQHRQYDSETLEAWIERRFAGLTGTFFSGERYVSVTNAKVLIREAVTEFVSRGGRIE